METVDFKKALETAKNLPTHIEGKLQPIYKMFTHVDNFFILYYSDDPVGMFYAGCLKAFRDGTEKFYIEKLPTYGPDLKLNPQNLWKSVLMFHKKWARKDIIVEKENISYQIVGLKRITTKLPAGVLVSNIKIHIE